MINLRFHIVSIVAVFLALAIGIFTGSTLLDRATVEVLQNRQRSLDRRNGELRTENDGLRAAIDRAERVEQGFDAQALPAVLPGTLSDRPVLIVAARGIDETSVRALQSAVSAAGASPLGIVWIDARTDLDDLKVRTAVATAIGVDPDGASKQSVITAIAAPRAAASAPGDGDVLGPDGLPVTTTTVAPDPDEAGPDVVGRLVDADLVDWESASEEEPAVRSLPTGDLDVIVLGGEGAELRASRFLTPLIRALAARVTGVLVGEVRTPRTPVDALGEGVPVRGVFVDQFRRDDDLADRLITIDDIDEPYGRLAATLALGRLPDLTSGAYGEAESAAAPFPPPPS